MSSTTSSDCESCDCSQCNYSFENNHNDYGKLLLNSRHIPMYAAMAHPLVYYAEIQQPLNRRQTCDQPRKDNPFKKAFKWYTQERSLCNKNDVAPERSGFADWLDNKYGEYLRENGQQTKGPLTSHEYRPPKNSVAEFCPPCQGTTKKFGRFKSSWRKRRRLGNDSGDVPEKCPAGSCQFLLKPNELTRAASETCYHTPTSGGKSNSTVASSNMPCNVKCSGRSYSLSDVPREKNALKYGDIVPHAVQQCPNCQNPAPSKLTPTICVCNQKKARTTLLKSMCVCPQDQGPSKKQNASNQVGPLCKDLQENVSVVVTVPSKVQDATNQQGPCCKCNLEKVPKVVQVPSQSRAVQESSQYPEEKIVPVHVEIQYEPISESPRSTQNLGPCCCTTCNKPIPLPPQLLCLPVKVQSNKIASPETCLTIAPAQNDAPKKQKARRLSVSCQAGEGNQSKIESQGQHQSEQCTCCKDTAPSQNNCREVNQVFGPIPIRRQSYSTVAKNEETGEYSIMKKVSVVNKFTRSVTCASNDAAQTSDHSICFEKDTICCQQPLLLKIIYADISKNE